MPASRRADSSHPKWSRGQLPSLADGTCPTCGGTWFDMGELAAVFDIEDTPSLAERYAEQRGAESAVMLGGLLGVGAAGHNEYGQLGHDSILFSVLQVVAGLVRLRF